MAKLHERLTRLERRYLTPAPIAAAIAELLRESGIGGDVEELKRTPELRKRLAIWMNENGRVFPGATAIRLPAWARAARPVLASNLRLQIMVAAE
jgi:hypothetical protein